jgi:GNAT superfamily N-acetyltransferase
MAGSRSAAEPVVTRASEDDWRAWRDVRLAALADAPDSFADTLAEAGALQEPDWRAMTRDGAIFIATAGRRAVGVAAGLPRPSRLERGLGAMWVAQDWRGRGVAPMLAGAVIAWARSQGCTRVGLWVPADNARARAFYERQGFRPTGRSRPFPGTTGRLISEMRLDLAPGQ